MNADSTCILSCTARRRKRASYGPPLRKLCSNGKKQEPRPQPPMETGDLTRCLCRPRQGLVLFAEGAVVKLGRNAICGWPVIIDVTRFHSGTSCSDSRKAPSSFSPRLACALIPCCGVEGRQRAQAKSQTEYRRVVLRLPDVDHFQNGRAQQPHFPGFAPGLSVCDQSVHHLVLLRTPLGFQSHRCRALSHVTGIS